MAVRTHSVMPGTPESGLPIIVQSRSPYATLAYAADPAGGVTPLTGYPSVYPHVLNVGAIPDFRAQYAQAPMPYAAYNAELMRLVMDGLQRRGGRGGGGSGTGQGTQQPAQAATPAAATAAPQMAAAHTSTLPAGKTPPGAPPPVMGPPAPPANPAPAAAALPLLAPAHEPAAIPVPVPGMGPISVSPFNGATYDPATGQVSYPQAPAAPQMAASHAPTSALAQAAGLPLIQPPANPDPITGQPVMQPAIPDMPMMSAHALVENPVQLPAQSALVAPQQSQTQSIWDRTLQENLTRMAPLLEASQAPDASLWDKIRAFYGIQNLMPMTFLQAFGRSGADLLGRIPNIPAPTPGQMAPYLMPKPMPVPTPMGPVFVPMP